MIKQPDQSKRYFGKLCEKHAEANGERLRSNSICVMCKKDKEKAQRLKRVGQIAKQALGKFYFGIVCQKHPILKGERRSADRKCVGCEKDRLLSPNSKEFYHSNKAFYKAKSGLYYKRNMSLVTIRSRSRQQKSTIYSLACEREKIEEFYKNRPHGHHVDHIIPLRGSFVSGLHVLANLQYLPAKVNKAKSNKFNIEADGGAQ